MMKQFSRFKYLTIVWCFTSWNIIDRRHPSRIKRIAFSGVDFIPINELVCAQRIKFTVWN
jgi:hypothetical protein